jgi:NDP-sugar pyrophosphorylase family protein
VSDRGQYVGAILAAGRGSRMGSLAERCPKALLPIGNSPLVEHQLLAMQAVGIRDVFVVVGHGGERIESLIGDGRRFGLRLSYVRQASPLGSAHAVGQLAPLIDTAFILMLGDYFVPNLDLARLIRRAELEGGSVILAKREPIHRTLQEACWLDVNSEGRVLRIVEKPKMPRSDLKGCGVLLLRAEIFDALRRTPRTMLRDEYELMGALDLYVRDGEPLLTEEIDCWDANLTRPADVLNCNLLWLADQNRDEFIGKNVRLPEGSRLERTVIGDDVTVAAPTVFREVVVFKGVQIDGGGTIERAVVTSDRAIPCEDAELRRRESRA